MVFYTDFWIEIVENCIVLVVEFNVLNNLEQLVNVRIQAVLLDLTKHEYFVNFLILDDLFIIHNILYCFFFEMKFLIHYFIFINIVYVVLDTYKMYDKIFDYYDFFIYNVIWHIYMDCVFTDVMKVIFLSRIE